MPTPIPSNDFIIAPVSGDETVRQRIEAGGWSSLAEMKEAGYLYILQPSEYYGTWTYVKDYGATIDASHVRLSWVKEDIVNAVTMRSHLAYSANGVDWTESLDVTALFATNFRYVRVRFEFGTQPSGTPIGLLLALTRAPDGVPTDKDICKVHSIRLRLSTKLKSDGGIVEITDAEAGAAISFNRTFSQIKRIKTSVISDVDADATTVTDFDGSAANPTGMTTYLYRSGVRATGVISWEVEGV